MTTGPTWTRHLTEGDEWTVRTALANVADELEKVAAWPDAGVGTTAEALRESARRYREVLDRIDRA